jgi:glycosyltransferase involved in cell wall biosynthesis
MFTQQKFLYGVLSWVCLSFALVLGVERAQAAEFKIGSQQNTSTVQKIHGQKILFLLGHLRCGGGERAFIDMLHVLDLPTSSYDVCVLQRGGPFEKFLPQGTNITSLQQAKKNSYTTIVVYADWLHPNIWGGIPTKHRVMFVHVDLSFFPNHPLRRKSCCEIFDQFVGVSDVATRSLLTYQPWCSERVKTIRNCIDKKHIKQDSRSLQTDIVSSPDRINIITVARLTNEKGIDRAIRVHKRLKNEGFDFRWYIIGDGDRRNKLETEALNAGLKGKFIFLGMKDNPYPYMKAADFLVMPSYSEAGPLVTTEALCLGCPPVATKVGSVSQQIKSGINGLVVDNSDQALYEGIKMLLKNKAQLETIKSGAARFEYDNTNSVHELMNMFFLQGKK